ncbi:MAG: HD-GYP domain protein [Comamonadaceae bacterium]|nr:MAG: HD-GYP domain protein [Comamonadaceae bacterium]
MDEPDFIEIDQLRVGQYVYLDLKWFDHPFAFSQFKIQNNEQIRVIKSLGLKRLRCNAELSDPAAYPVLGQTVLPEPVKVESEDQSEFLAAMAEKRAIMAQMALRKAAVERIESAFADTAQVIRDIDCANA